MSEEQAAKKKGLSPLAWIGIGCGVLILIAFFVMSAGLWFGGKMINRVVEDFEEDPARKTAELIVKMNPELELVETDKDEGTITVRIKESGEVATFDYSQIEEGKLTFESPEGKMTFDAQGTGEDGVFKLETGEGITTWGAGEIPGWIPEHPNAEALVTVYSQDAGVTTQGAFNFTTTDEATEVLAFFTERLEDDGFSVQENTTAQDGDLASAILIARDDATGRHAQISVTPEDGGTRVDVSYGQSE
jgi:hypothetical protein